MFDYFYGNETEQYHYYSVPKLLFTDDKFKGLSCQAKLLYGFLLDRTALSVENKWFDKQGRTYVYYKQSDAQNNLNIGKNKATAIFTELENIGLIIRQKQGQGKPTKIFVMNFTKFIGKQRDTARKENEKAISQTPENRESENVGRESRLPKTGSLNSTKEGVKTPKNREHNKPEINKPNGRYIYPSISLHNTDNRESDRDSDKPLSDGRIDGNPPNSEILIYQNAIAEVKLQIEYMYLIENHQHESAFLDLIVNLMAEVYGLAKTNPSSSVPINGINKSIVILGGIGFAFYKLKLCCGDEVPDKIQRNSKYCSVPASVSEHFTSPPKQYTDATLLSAMETAGNTDYVEDSNVEKKGLGTPATRAGIIENLVKRQYIQRDGRKILPTEKGIQLIDCVPDDVKSPKMTAVWETALQHIEKGAASADEFMNQIEDSVKYLVDTYSEVDNSKHFTHWETVGICPKCGQKVLAYPKSYACENKECDFVIWKNICGKSLSSAQAVKLLTKGKTDTLKGLKSKSGKSFDAAIKLNSDFKTEFVFSSSSKSKKSYRK